MAPRLWYGTQGPSDMLFTPPGFIVCEKSLNNQDIIGLKMVVVPTKGTKRSAELLRAFGDPTEAVPAAVLALMEKISAAQPPSQLPAGQANSAAQPPSQLPAEQANKDDAGSADGGSQGDGDN